MMKNGSTLFLKLALFLMAIPVLVFVIVAVPWLINNPVNPDYTYILYPIVIGVFISIIPYFLALFQSYKLLSFIDQNQAFSDHSVQALKVIKFCALSVSGIYIVLLPFIYFLAELDDAPGLILIGLVFVFAALVIAVFAAVLQRLLKEAIDIKSENDLTV